MVDVYVHVTSGFVVVVVFFLLVALQWVLRDFQCHYQDEVFLRGGLTGVSNCNNIALCSVRVADTFRNGTRPSCYHLMIISHMSAQPYIHISSALLTSSLTCLGENFQRVCQIMKWLFCWLLCKWKQATIWLSIFPDVFSQSIVRSWAGNREPSSHFQKHSWKMICWLWDSTMQYHNKVFLQCCQCLWFLINRHLHNMYTACTSTLYV